MNDKDDLMTKAIAFGTGQDKGLKFQSAAGYALAGMIGVALWALAILSPSYGQTDNTITEQEALNFVQDLAAGALDTLSLKTVSHDERKDQFRNLLEDGFQIEHIGLLALGNFRRTATPEEIETYQFYFEEFILQKYSELLSDYAGEEFVVVSAYASGKKDIIVQAEIRGNGIEIVTNWRVRKFDGNPKIIDIKVEGISMLQSQREEFSAILRNGGMESLIAQLRSAVGASANEQDA